jgi:hypothetical protein
MQFCGPKQGIISLVLTIPIIFTMLSFPSGQDQYAYSQSSETNPTVKAAVTGVDLINIHPSPSHLKAGSKFEILATVVNNSPSTIMFVAGACHSPLSAFFKSSNAVIRHTQGCTATSPPFKLKSGERVSVAGPSSGTIYQAVATGRTPATATLYYQTENGQPANVTKPFVFTIS